MYHVFLCNVCIKVYSGLCKTSNTAQKMKFSIKDFFSECDQIRSFLRIWSHLLKKSLMKNFILCEVQTIISFFDTQVFALFISGGLLLYFNNYCGENKNNK